MDVTDKFSILSLNCLDFFTKANPSEVDPETQFKWLEAHFNEKSDRKYIVTDRISAGVSHKDEVYWDDHWNTKYFDMIKNN